MLFTSVRKVLLFFFLLSVVPVCLLVLQKLVNTAVVLLQYRRVLCDGTEMLNELFLKVTFSKKTFHSWIVPILDIEVIL